MTELVRPNELNERMRYAHAMADASLLPAAYRKQPANILLALEYADGLGLSPIAAIQGVHVIDGKPSASAQLIGSLVRRAGHRLRVTIADDGKSARATIVRSDDPEFEFESVWTMERAAAAGLVNKAVWKQYPANLLKARAITEVARDACPEVLSGVSYTPEELGHDEEPPAQAAFENDAWEVDSAAEEIAYAEIVDEPMVTAAQLTKIGAQFTDLGIKKREERLLWCFDAIGHTITTANDLTRIEASLLIERQAEAIAAASEGIDHEPLISDEQ